MTEQKTFLVFGATGGTGRHFVARALADGHRVRALVRNPARLTTQSDRLAVWQGSIADPIDIDALVAGVDFVIVMLGDKEAQKHARINTAFVRTLVPAMRRQGVARLLYQAGGFSRPYGRRLPPLLWFLRNTLARGFDGQHQDNEAVMAYLATEAVDIEWIVHRAGIGSDGPSKGVLHRSDTRPSIATFRDCADYSYRTVVDADAVHTCSFSRYALARTNARSP